MYGKITNLRQHKIQMDKFALKLYHANMSEYTEDLVGINQNNKWNNVKVGGFYCLRHPNKIATNVYDGLWVYFVYIYNLGWKDFFVSSLNVWEVTFASPVLMRTCRLSIDRQINLLSLNMRM